MLEDLVAEVLNEDHKTIADDLLLLAEVWVREEGKGEAGQLGRIYKYLLRHSNPESVFRIKRKYLEAHPDMKERWEDPKYLRQEVLETQSDLFSIGKKHLEELKEKFK